MNYRIGALVCGAVLTANSAYAETTEWTLGYLGLRGTVYEEVALQMPERIAEATDGRLQITANSSLVAGNRLLEAVRDGLVQISLPIPAYYTGTQPLFTIHSIPGVSESYDDLKALSASEIGTQIRTVFNDTYNSTQLMETAFCPQTLFSTKQIASVDEWEGRKLRVNNRGMGIMGAKLGATTVSLSAGEVLPALERGVIEGVITDTCWAYGAGFGSVISHAAAWKLGSVLPAPVLVNNDAWDALPDDLKPVVKAEFEEMSAEIEALWRQRVEELPKQWQDAGVAFSEISEEETKRVYADEYQMPVLEVWRGDMKRAGLDADAVLATARSATQQKE